ncbi:branched-chain amino acid transport system ATP-binding protein [Rhodoligotrophos appendicifer]|uniref:ABC transporter ATP-binding protein n=1 Tax=Rhodoligotrophos appendicifer TaxID=987056 RepID=UPI0011864235|nr:ABC transporter ATP-binding protein [Rhodoligotrophos appendicifer]
MLDVSNLSKSFGGLKALSELSFAVSPGQILGLIGPNGSGKTTTINVITGLLPASAGRIRLNGSEITRNRSDQIAKSGMTRTFQNLRLFNSQTVRNNVRSGQGILCRSLLSKISAIPTSEERQLRVEAEDLLARFSLADRADWPASALSYGEKKRLELARAMAMRPRVLLLDEPAAGMNPVELDWLTNIIREIGASGVAVVLVEHHMKLVMSVCHKIVVLNFGQKIAEGPPEEIAKNPDVITAYLGKAH